MLGSAGTQNTYRLVAIDTGVDTNYHRDEWMGWKISEILGNRAIIVLSGKKHVLKNVDWTVESGRASIVEIPVREKFTIKFYAKGGYLKTVQVGTKEPEDISMLKTRNIVYTE